MKPLNELYKLFNESYLRAKQCYLTKNKTIAKRVPRASELNEALNRIQDSLYNSKSN